MSFGYAMIVRRDDLTDDLMKIWLLPDTRIDFKPGQYCTIGLFGEDGKLIGRPYSIASAPHEAHIELFIERVPEGELTPFLWKLYEGNNVFIRPRAKGIFTLDFSYVNHMMVATVTGVVPYISMLRHHIHMVKDTTFDSPLAHRFFVVQGASYMDEFGYDAELGALARHYPDIIRYVPTVSRPSEERNASWRLKTGRANLVIEECLEYFGLSSEDTLVYACGNPGMVKDIKMRLVPRGWKVKEERFWK